MNPDSENFDQLKKLLALKRHEVPPPGYFNNFSAKVIARIEAGDGAESAGWVQRFWAFIETKPMLTGVFGAAVCAMALSGFVFSEEGQGGAVVNANTRVNPFGASSQPVAMNVANPTLFASTNQVSPDLQNLLNAPGFGAGSLPATFGLPNGGN